MCGIASSIRDWELMVAYSAKAKSDPSLDPFVFTSANLLEAKLMSETGLVHISDQMTKLVDNAIGRDYAILPLITART